MKNKIETIQQLKAVIEYIIWSYDINVSALSDKLPEVIVQDLSNVWCVKIKYIAEIIKAEKFVDPTLGHDDEEIITYSEFLLLKTESFRQLTKYVEDICEEISKINLEV